MSSNDCIIYRCSKQAETYLYLRPDVERESLPEGLLRKTGKLTQVMELNLSKVTKLARVDVARVMEQLAAQGWFLQLPPPDMVDAHLHFGD